MEEDFWNSEWGNFDEDVEPTTEAIQQIDEDEEWLKSIQYVEDEEEDEYAELRADPYLADWIPLSVPKTKPVDSNFSGIFKNEGAKTGQPTNLNSSAIGRGQMIKGTRLAMYKKLGITDVESAEQAFKTDPNFEMQVLNAYRGELDQRIPSNIQGKDREYMIAKGWYTGNPFYDDNTVPGKSAGNKLTAGEYARRATMQYGGVNNIPELEGVSDEALLAYFEEEGIDIENYQPYEDQQVEVNEQSGFQKAANIGLQAVDKFNQVKNKLNSIGAGAAKSVSDAIDIQSEMAGYQRDASSMRKFNEQKNRKKYSISKSPLNQPLIYT